MTKLLVACLVASLGKAESLPRARAQQLPAQFANVDPQLYERYAGNYQLAANRVVSIGPFYENGDRLTFYDSSTRRVGVLYDLSATDFVSGVMQGSEFLAGNVRVTFTRNREGVVTGLTWREGDASLIQARRVSPHRNEEVAFRNGEVVLRGTLTLPANAARFPVVVLLHGSGPARRPLGVWQYFLARYGIATLTFDKRGAGASTGDWQTASFEDLAGDALAAVLFLRARKDINPRQIGLWSNSNSGWVVPIAAARSTDVAFIVSRVGSALPPYENVLYEIENEARRIGLSDLEIGQAIALRTRYNQSLITNAGWEQLKADAERARTERWLDAARLRWMLTLQVPPDAATLRSLRNPLVIDPIPFWERVTCPVLALFGELDMNVQTTRSVPLLEAALKRAGNKDGTIVVLPGATHGLAEAATDSTPEARLNRRYAAGYMDQIISWLQRNIDARK